MGCQGTPEIAMAGVCIVVLSYLTSDSEPKKSKYQRSLEKKQPKKAKKEKKEKKEKKPATPMGEIDMDMMKKMGESKHGGG